MVYIQFRLKLPKTNENDNHMSQEKVIKLLAGAAKIAKESQKIIKTTGSQFIENNVIKGNYVTREEFDQLRNLVIKLEKELQNHRTTIPAKQDKLVTATVAYKLQLLNLFFATNEIYGIIAIQLVHQSLDEH